MSSEIFKIIANRYQKSYVKLTNAEYRKKLKQSCLEESYRDTYNSGLIDGIDYMILFNKLLRMEPSAN